MKINNDFPSGFPEDPALFVSHCVTAQTSKLGL
jgi:hypothetical protein